MRNRVILLLTVCLLASVFGSLASAAELRGIWVDGYHHGIYTPDETAKTVAKAKECNLNAIFVQVRRRGDVFYASRIEPTAKEVASGYDPLADVVEKAHAAGIQVHAWVSMYEAFHINKWTATYPSQLHKKHPEWLCKDQKDSEKFFKTKLYLDPGHPEVRPYLVSIVNEIVSDYKVDGVHLDVLRYPGRESGYNKESMALFNKEKNRSGKPAPEDAEWCKWRQEQVTKLVRDVHDNLAKSKHRVLLSVSVEGDAAMGIRNLQQDWMPWVKTGIVDFAVPMVFPMDTRVFETYTKRIIAEAGADKVCIGQAGYKMEAEKSVEQLSAVRAAGAAGFVIYNYDSCKRANEFSATPLLDVLKTGIFAKPDKSSF